VNAQAPFGGGVFIADTSAWGVVEQLPEAIKRDWEQALENNKIASSPAVALETLYSAQNAQEFDYWAARLWALPPAVISRQAWWATVEGYRELAHQGRHRHVPFPDLLTAGAATAHHYGVLHYDRHYDELAALDAFTYESRWIAAPGTV